MNSKTSSNEAVLRVTGPDLLGPVLTRVVAMLVARAESPIDTLDDAMLLADAIAAHAPDFTNGDTIVRVRTAPDSLSLGVGPFDAGTGQSFLESTTLPDVGNVVERVAHSVHHDGDTLLLTLRFDV